MFPCNHDYWQHEQLNKEETQRDNNGGLKRQQP